MHRFNPYLLILFFTLFAYKGKAQTEGNPTQEFIYYGRHYVPHSPWWNVGMGYGYSFGEQAYEPNFLVDVHFRVAKKHYLATGFMTSRNQFLDHDTEALLLPQSYLKHNVNSLHAMYGWRVERLYNNFAFFIGPAFNWGYQYAYTDSLTGNYFVYPYKEAGLYASLQYSRKFFYDLGMGATLFASVNKSYQVVGLTLHFYFSTAYKRTLPY